MNNKFCVVIPLYNKVPYIKRAIFSILNQTYQNFEIIVIDDGSTDGSGEIVSALNNPRIRLIRQKNLGVSAARNRGILESKTEFITFLDADDEWKPGFLMIINNLISKYPQCGAYATSYENMGINNKIYMPRLYGIQYKNRWVGILENYFITALGDPPFCSSSIAIPKSVFLKIGGFPLGIKLGEDPEMWLRIAINYQIAFDCSLQAIYHKEAEDRACKKFSVDEEYLLIKTGNFALKQNIVPLNLVDGLTDYIAKYKIIYARECIWNERKDKAVQVLKSCSFTRRLKLKWIWWYFWATMPLWIIRCGRFLKSYLFKS
jgi:glycosyltransferase involved in cell wall biosynthesis